MRLLLFVSALFVSAGAMADSIDLGQASNYNIFVKGDYTVETSDVEGRVAVGGDLNVNGGYDVGTHVTEFGMGDGPSLVVGGDINKSGTGFLNVYNSQALDIDGTAAVGGSVNLSQGGIEAQIESGSELPVNFDSAFAHLENLSEQLANRTANGQVADEGWKLDFTVDPNVVPEDGVYVFNVTQDMFTTDWYLHTEGLADDATIVFNISNPGSTSVNLTQSTLFLNDHTDRMSSYFTAGAENQDPSFQVLYNFHGVNTLEIGTELYGSVLAPTADITMAGAGTPPIYGQVIGKSWESNSQINFNPFDPIGDPTNVSEAPTIVMVALAFVVLFGRRMKLTMPTLSRRKLALA